MKIRTLMAATYLRQFASIIAAMLFAWAAGPEARGLLAVIVLVDSASSELVVRGVPQAVAWATGRPEYPAPLLNGFIRTKTFSSCAPALIGALVSLWLVRDQSVAILVLVFCLVAMSPFEVAVHSHRQRELADGRTGAAVWIALSASGIVHLPIIAFASFGYANVVLVAALMVMLRLTLISLFGMRLLIKSVRPPTERSVTLNRFAKNSAVSTIGQQVQGKLDILALALLAPKGELGSYSVTVSIVALPLWTVITLANKYFHERKSAIGDSAHTRRNLYAAGLMGTVSVPIGTLVCVYALESQGYTGLLTYGFILAPSPFLFAVFMARRAEYEAAGLPRPVARSQVFGIAVVALLVLPGYLVLDTAGVAVATVLGYLARAAFINFGTPAALPAWHSGLLPLKKRKRAHTVA